MIRRVATLAVLLSASALAYQEAPTNAGARAKSERTHLVILHTNDIHGQVLPRPAVWLDEDDPPNAGALARVAAYVQSIREEAADKGFGLLVVDGGDWFQGTPEGLIEDGRSFLGVLKAVGYDAMCVGNHEFDHGVRALLEHLAAIEPPALLANVSDSEGKRLPGTRPYLIFERGGLRIAVVGLITLVTPSITHQSARELEFFDAAEALRAVRVELAKIEPAVDWILPLTHLGVSADRALARAHPDLDLIVGGHSHSYLKEGTTQGRTLIVQAGSKASGVGRVDLWFDPRTKQVVESRSQIVDLYEEPPPDARVQVVDEGCAKLVEASAQVMAEVVGTLAGPFKRTRERFQSSPAGNLVTDVMRAHTGAELALQNRGGIRADLRAGEVTRRDLFEILPFGNHIEVLSMTGAELEALMKRTVEGTGHSGLELSGGLVEVHTADGFTTLARMSIGGEDLQRDRSYRVATNSFLAGGGDGYEEFSAIAEREIDPILLREMFEKALRATGTLTPPVENRFRVRE